MEPMSIRQSTDTSHDTLLQYTRQGLPAPDLLSMPNSSFPDPKMDASGQI